MKINKFLASTVVNTFREANDLITESRVNIRRYLEMASSPAQGNEEIFPEDEVFVSDKKKQVWKKIPHPSDNGVVS